MRIIQARDSGLPCVSAIAAEPLDPSDSELISMTRAGDNDAWARLYERHVVSAERVALRLAGRDNGPDLVADAFMRIWATLRSGKGPEYAFRSYLMTTIRNLHYNRLRDESRMIPTPDERLGAFALPVLDVGDQMTESTILAQAFASLPDRWKAVLWHAVVEEEAHDVIAARLGVSRSNVAALAYRAREGLRHAYLAQHVAESADRACREIRVHLPAYHRGQGTEKARRQVDAHLEHCDECRLVIDGLGAIMSPRLAGLLVPALLGLSLDGYLASPDLSVESESERPDAVNNPRSSQQVRLPHAREVVRTAGPLAAVAAGVAVAALAAAQVLSGAASGDDRSEETAGLPTSPGTSLPVLPGPAVPASVATRRADVVPAAADPVSRTVIPQPRTETPVGPRSPRSPVPRPPVPRPPLPRPPLPQPPTHQPPSGPIGTPGPPVPPDDGDIAGRPGADLPTGDAPAGEVPTGDDSTVEPIALGDPMVRQGGSLPPGTYQLSLPVTSTAAGTDIAVSAPGLMSLARSAEDSHGTMSCDPVQGGATPTAICHLSEPMDAGEPVRIDLVLSGDWAGGAVSATASGVTDPGSSTSPAALPVPGSFPTDI